MRPQRLATVLCVPVFCLAVWALSPSAYAAGDLPPAPFAGDADDAAVPNEDDEEFVISDEVDDSDEGDDDSDVAAGAVAATQGPYRIWAWHSQQCITALNPLGSDYPLYQHHCDDDSYRQQSWHFEDTTGGYYRIRTSAGPACMNVQGSSITNSAKVIANGCHDISSLSDQWKPVYQRTVRISGRSYDYYRLVNRRSGKCLNVQRGSMKAGAALIQFTCGEGIGNDEFTWDYDG